MNPKAAFTINEIMGVSLSIPIPPDGNNTLENIVKSLHAGNFKTTRSFAAKFTSVVDDLFSQITFMGKGFAFGLSKTKFSAQFLRMLEFVHSEPEVRMEDEVPSKLFTKENLDQISSEFNYILGLILGKLNFNNENHEFIFTIHLSKDILATRDLTYLLTPESKTAFGEITDFQLQGIDMNLVENLFKTAVKSEYSIHQNTDDVRNKNSFIVHAQFKFNYSGPVDFFNFVSKSINRLNDLTENIMRDSNESKN